MRDIDLKPMTFEPDEPGRQILAIRLALKQAAADADEGGGFHRLRGSMIRVVGSVAGAPRQYRARVLGGAVPGSAAYRLAEFDQNFAAPVTGGDTLVDAFFVVDEQFEPRFVEYRRFARAPVTGAPAETAPVERLVGQQSAAELRRRTVGASRFLDAIIESGTGDTNDLPFTMTASAIAGEAELADQKLKSGRISGPRSRFSGAGPTAIREFAVPEGWEMFQLRANANEARSVAGQVFDFVGSVINQYTATTKSGEAFPLAGYYGIVERDGAEYIELFVSGEPGAPGFRGMLDFKSIQGNELRDRQAIIGLIFYVKPGVTITRVGNQAGHGVEFEPGYQVGD
jgi:hypothetical protein